MQFEDDGRIVRSALKKSKIKLFSCEKDQAVATTGACEVKLKNVDFKCVTQVIVANGLANDFLIGIYILVRWPAMIEAIGVLLKNERTSERRVVSDDSMIARLHNICLQRILADEAFRDRHLKGKHHGKTIETGEVVNVIGVTKDMADRVEKREEDVVEIIEDDEFRAQYLPEERGADFAINFISNREIA